MVFKFYQEDIDYNVSIGNLINIDKNSKYTLTNSVFLNFLKINNIDFKMLGDRYQKISNMLNHNSNNINLLVGRKNYNNFLIDLRDKLSFCKNNLNSYYFSLLVDRINLTQNLKPLLLNKKSIETPLYDHMSHKTGRVKIIKGFNYLICKKNKKEKLTTKDNTILAEIDFKSAEPSLLYSLLYQKTVNDIYASFNIEAPRDKIKLAVISCLYGASNNRIKKMTGIESKHVDKIKDILNVKNLTDKLENRFDANGHIKNIYGRHIYGNANLVNYWLQSSAADYALSCFNYFKKTYQVNINAIIHDAIIFSCSQDTYNKVNKLKSLFDPITNIALPIEVKKITKNI